MQLLFVAISVTLDVIDKLRDIAHVNEAAHLLLVEHVEDFDLDDALTLVNDPVRIVSFISLKCSVLVRSFHGEAADGTFKLIIALLRLSEGLVAQHDFTETEFLKGSLRLFKVVSRVLQRHIWALLPVCRVCQI